MCTDSHVKFYMDTKITGKINQFFNSMEFEIGRTILKQKVPEEPGKFLSYTWYSRI